MRVLVDEREYTLYLTGDGLWTMHTFNPFAPIGERWLDTHYDVSNRNPFINQSVVLYDSWR